MTLNVDIVNILKCKHLVIKDYMKISVRHQHILAFFGVTLSRRIEKNTTTTMLTMKIETSQL
jgi:hypothetical protein